MSYLAIDIGASSGRHMLGKRVNGKIELKEVYRFKNGPKMKDGTPWVIGIQDPDDSGKNLHTLYLTKGSVVTSGDYQRTYMVDGQAYHHIIDPQTLMPASYWRSVSIVCRDSGLADALSTGLFLMDYEQGKALAQKCGAEVLWVALDGTEFMTSGFKANLRN